MQRTLLSLAVLLFTALMGCGPSTCDRLAASAERLVVKYTPCMSEGREYTSEYDKARCEEYTKSCSFADHQGFNRFADCLDRLGTCQPDQLEAWLKDYLGCVDEIHLPSSCGT